MRNVLARRCLSQFCYLQFFPEMYLLRRRVKVTLLWYLCVFICSYITVFICWLESAFVLWRARRVEEARKSYGTTCNNLTCFAFYNHHHNQKILRNLPIASFAMFFNSSTSPSTTLPALSFNCCTTSPTTGAISFATSSRTSPTNGPKSF